METTLAVLGVADAEEVMALQTAAYAPEAALDDDQRRLPSLVQSLDDLSADLGDARMISIGLRDVDGRLIAAVRAYVGGATAHVGRLCVAPDRQGNGLATALLAALEQRVPADVREVRIFTGEDAVTSHHFYAKLGYLQTRHEGMEAGFHVVELSKKISVPEQA